MSVYKSFGSNNEDKEGRVGRHKSKRMKPGSLPRETSMTLWNPEID